ncbi:unnamed protein product [Ambrosiozyma monospora]|uniref:Unnamed protein product n=1 Tax=Ambrosiozyma monospora TaxID=43982 RepID=A0A9W7DJK8_AMBMO|nr:unnamed protein product [Ambrosiozyma monospora]
MSSSVVEMTSADFFGTSKVAVVGTGDGSLIQIQFSSSMDKLDDVLNTPVSGNFIPLGEFNNVSSALRSQLSLRCLPSFTRSDDGDDDETLDIEIVDITHLSDLISGSDERIVSKLVQARMLLE